MKTEYIFYIVIIILLMIQILLLLTLFQLKDHLNKLFGDFDTTLKQSLRAYKIKIDLVDESIQNIHSEIESFLYETK